MKNFIKVERAKQNITQGELAEKVKVSRQTINSIEIVFTDITADGTPLIDFNTCTDISSYKTENSLKVIIYKKVDQSYNQVYEYKINEQIDLLTQRQIEILNLLSKGYTTCQIAEKLFLSEETVKIHRKNILHRTGAKNSIQAVNLLMNGDLASNHVSTRMNNVHHSLV